MNFMNNNKHKHKVSHFYFYLCTKLEFKTYFKTYFVYFHTFSCKFKVQRTPTEFGLPVLGLSLHIFLWKMRAPGACIKPSCLARRPLCHKVNLPASCEAQRLLCHKVKLLSCVARRPSKVPQSKSTELCSSAAVIPQSNSTEM